MHIRYRVDLEGSEREHLAAIAAGGTRAVRRGKRARFSWRPQRACPMRRWPRRCGWVPRRSIAPSSTLWSAGWTGRCRKAHGAAETETGGDRRSALDRDGVRAAAHRAGALDAGAAGLGSRAVHTASEHFARDHRPPPGGERPQTVAGKNVVRPGHRCPVRRAYGGRARSYTTLPRPGTAVVCVDETPQQLIGEVRSALPPVPGHPAYHDYEYRRKRHRECLRAVDAHHPRRYTKVTARRTAVDFAEWLRDLVDVHYVATERLLLVLDNLSTHTPAALYEAFAPAEARLYGRLEFHYVPKHASWLNMVEIEIGILSTQCLARRVQDLPTLTDEVDAWTRARNAVGARVRWMFGIEQACTKMGHAYPSVAAKEAAA
jgi:DDE superfamily endonuclease